VIPSAAQISASHYQVNMFGRHDEILAVRGHNLDKRLRRRLHVAVHQHLAGGVENADVHGLHVEIDSAIVTVLAVVESHRSSSCAIARFIPAAAYWQSVGAGGGLNKNHAVAADGGRHDPWAAAAEPPRWADRTKREDGA
jgi:hypothetical protein